LRVIMPVCSRELAIARSSRPTSIGRSVAVVLSANLCGGDETGVRGAG
jgi:hypothetical protein